MDWLLQFLNRHPAAFNQWGRVLAYLLCEQQVHGGEKTKSRKCPSTISPAVISRGPGFPLPCADTTDWHCRMAQCSSGFSSLGACSGSFSWHVVLQVAESWSCASGCLLVWSCKAMLYFSAPYYHLISQQKGKRNGQKALGIQFYVTRTAGRSM